MSIIITQTSGPHDLMIVIDCTAPMKVTASILEDCLPSIITFMAFTGYFDRIGVLVYRNYISINSTKFSGWWSPWGITADSNSVTHKQILEFAERLWVQFGQHKAVRPGLARAYQEMREDATTAMLLYTSGPPHFTVSDSPNGTTENQERIQLEASYSSGDGAFADWVTTARTLAGKELGSASSEKAIVFPIMDRELYTYVSISPYVFLSAITGGATFLTEVSPSAIPILTLEVLLTWMGSDVGAKERGGRTMKVDKIHYIDEVNLGWSTSETHPIFSKYCSKHPDSDDKRNKTNSMNMARTTFKLPMMPRLLKARGLKLCNIRQQFQSNQNLQTQAWGQLQNIEQLDVRRIAFNAIFGDI
ncbi:hypothetical protein FGRMN_1245 [Fusarium graminum]|nr:hypothetical protein FGRMN_1245 [Fusarium graminum]